MRASDCAESSVLDNSISTAKAMDSKVVRGVLINMDLRKTKVDQTGKSLIEPAITPLFKSLFELFELGGNDH